MNKKIAIFTTGGTIDKVYFDAKSEFEVGEPQIEEMLTVANVTVEYQIIPVIRKDSLDMTDEDRALLKKGITECDADEIIVTHGTDTMIESALSLGKIGNKTIVFTGSMQPARLKNSDAAFNVAGAMFAVQLLNPGVYIAMNGRVFDPAKSRKNRGQHRFEAKQ